MTTLDELAKRLNVKQQTLAELHGQMKFTLRRTEEVKDEIKELQEEINNLDKSSAVLNSIGEDLQIKAQDTIEALVTRGLQQIFDESLSFHIIQNVKAKSVSVEFVVRTTLPDMVVDTPVMDARGGGLAATIGFLLRVVIMLLKNGRDKDNILILDETFAMVSDEYLEGLGEFLRELVDKTGIQILMVTHQPIFAEYADAVYKFTAENGKTKVEAL